MSFGYSVGDVIAIAGVIERIVNEVKAFQSAPLHFQRLAIELDFLSSVCKQVFELRPSLPDELHQVERIRAIAIQCLGPLQEFEDKMAKYDNTLGPRRGNWCVTGNRKRKRDRVKDIGKRLHWSVIARQDVDELRAILTSEILAINTLLTMVEWSSLKSQNFVNQTYSSQLRTLIRTTNDASTDIKQFLIDAKSASEHLQQLIMSGNLTQKEQIRILTTIENKTHDMQTAVRDLSRWNKQYTSSVHNSINDISNQVVKLFSFKRYMEDWIRQIVRYCQNIIAMVERNTQILLSLHDMMAKLSVLLSRRGISLPILEFENPFGHKLALPYQLCDTWDGLNRILLCMFFDKPGLKFVEAGRFLVTNTKTNRIIKPNLWATSVAPGDGLFMSMVLERMGCGRKSCPRCDQPLPTMSRSGATCQSCRLWSSIGDDKSATLGVSESSQKMGIPTPPPEPIDLRGSAWDGSWTSDYVREQTRLQSLASSKKRRRVLNYDDAINSKLPDLTDDEVEETFRRVHVIPYQGDPLEALVKIGVRCRNLMFQFSSHPPSALLSLSSPPFEATFAHILDDIEEIHISGINPLLELTMRQGSAVRHQIMQTYLYKTAMILRDAPLGDCFSPMVIQKLVEWLSTSNGQMSRHRDYSRGYDFNNHPLLGTKYWQHPYQWQYERIIFLDTAHIRNLDKHAKPTRKHMEALFTSFNSLGHGSSRRVYGVGDVNWLDFATHYETGDELELISEGINISRDLSLPLPYI